MPNPAIDDILSGLSPKPKSAVDDILADLQPSVRGPLAPPPLPSPQQMAGRALKPVDRLSMLPQASPSADYGGLGTVEPITEQQRKQIWNPEEGVSNIAAGAREVVAGHPVIGANKVFRGAAEVGKPAALAAMMTNPTTAAIALGAGMAAQQGTQTGLEAMGVDPDVAELGGNIAGSLPIAGGAAKIMRGSREPVPFKPNTAAERAKRSVRVETGESVNADARLAKMMEQPVEPMAKPTRSVAEQIVDEVAPKQEAPKSFVADEVMPEPVQPEVIPSAQTRKPLYEMSREELDQELAAAKMGDHELEVALFGAEGAKRYRAAQRTANSSYDQAKADAAYKIVEQMETALSESQRNKLYGIGDDTYTADELKDFRDAVGSVDGGSPEELAKSLKWAVTGISKKKNPADMTHAERLRYAQLREGYRIAQENGWDTAEISRMAGAEAASRFTDKEDAAYMLSHMTQGQRPQARPNRAGLPEPVPAAGSKEVIQQPEPEVPTPQQAGPVDRVTAGQQIRDAINAADPNSPMSLEKLRAQFPDVPRNVIDTEVRNMMREGKAEGFHDTHPPEYVRQNMPWALEGQGADGRPEFTIGVAPRKQALPLAENTRRETQRGGWSEKPTNKQFTPEQMAALERYTQQNAQDAQQRGLADLIADYREYPDASTYDAITGRLPGNLRQEVLGGPVEPQANARQAAIKAASQGFSDYRQEISRPMPQVDEQAASQVADQMLATIRKMAQRPGTSISIGKLRQALPVDKALFDRAAVMLQERRQALLAVNDHAQRLPATDRALLVRNGDKFFGSIYERTPELAEPQRGNQRGSWSEKARAKGAPPEDKYLNLDRMGLEGESEQVLREQVRQFGQEKYGGDFKPTETHEAVRKAAGNVTPESMRQLMQSDMGIENRATRDAIHTSLRTQAEELTAMRSALETDRAKLTPEDLAIRERSVQQKTDELREMAGVWSDIGTSDARNLAMRRMVAAAVEQAISPGSKEAVHGWLDMVSALRKAGLLTGLKTHLRNVVGTGAFQVMEEASRIPASMLDMAISTFGKRDRTVTGASLRGMVNASRKGATEGVREAMNIMRKGATSKQLASSDMSRELNFQGLGKASKVINTYVNTVFRTLGAEDQLARTYATRRSLEGQAKVLALNEARAGKIKQQDVLRRAQNLADNPTESMAAQAIADAEFATFNNDNQLASGLSRMRGALGKPGQFTMDMVMPFTKTPTNIIARLLDYTPLGATYRGGKAIAKSIIDKSLSAEQQRELSLAFGRGAVGTGLIYLGYKMAENGYATGTRPDDPSQANAAEATGRSPGAIRIGNTWARISAFSPVGNLITIGATLQRESSRNLRDEAKRPGNLAAVATRTIMEQPMLQGTQQMIEALEKPTQKGEAFAGTMAGSFVPTLVSDVGTAIDPTRRDQRTGTSTMGTVKNAVASRLPIVRESLPERYDVLGRPLGGDWTASWNPLLPNAARETKDPLDREIVKHQLGLSASKQDTSRAWKRGADKISDPETEDEFRLRSRARGLAMQKAMRNVIQHPRYNGAAPERQKAALEKAMNRAQDVVSEAVRSPRYRNADEATRLALLNRLIDRFSK